VRQELRALREMSDRVEKEVFENEHQDKSATQVISAEPLEEWETYANGVLNIKLVTRETDLEDSSKTFHPAFTHQIFDRQLIYGYKDPKIDMFYVAGSLRMYLRLGCSATRHTGSGERPNTDVFRTILQYVPHDYFSALDPFVQELHKPFTPVGKKIHSYTIDLENEEEGVELEYEVTKGNFAMKDVKEYHSRIQIFVLWFIDRSSYISSNDLNWEIYYIFEKRKEFGEEFYSVVGYATVYPFYSHPGKQRLRISQTLILPSFQKKGHGAALLNAIYANARERTEARAVRDITVEDPSPEFTFVRNITDLRNCLANGFFNDKEQVLQPMDEELITAIQEKLLLYRKQILHLHEMMQFLNINRADEAWGRFVLTAKKRLFKKYQDWLENYEEGEARKKELNDIYVEEVEEFYTRIAEKLPQCKL